MQVREESRHSSRVRSLSSRVRSRYGPQHDTTSLVLVASNKIMNFIFLKEIPPPRGNDPQSFQLQVGY